MRQKNKLPLLKRREKRGFSKKGSEPRKDSERKPENFGERSIKILQGVKEGEKNQLRGKEKKKKPEKLSKNSPHGGRRDGIQRW